MTPTSNFSVLRFSHDGNFGISSYSTTFTVTILSSVLAVDRSIFIAFASNLPNGSRSFDRTTLRFTCCFLWNRALGVASRNQVLL